MGGNCWPSALAWCKRLHYLKAVAVFHSPPSKPATSNGHPAPLGAHFRFLDLSFRIEWAIPATGDGASAANPQKVLFFVSDGTNDGYDCAYSNGSSCRRITPLDTTSCTTLKNRGVRIAVLYTTYWPLPTNSFYNQYVAKYVSPTSQIATQMQSCASPGLYFEVSPSQGISAAMTALFQRVVSVVRINA